MRTVQDYQWSNPFRGVLDRQIERRPVPETNKRNNLLQEAAQAQEILYVATTVFPFVLFPDTVSIDRVKTTITRRVFFGVAQVTSIQIEDVLNVAANTGPFFGSIKLWTRFFSNEPLKVNYLSRKDALAIKAILQGYIIARHKKIDTSTVPRGRLALMLQQLGEGVTEEPSQT